MKKLYFAIVALLLCAISANAKTVYFKPNSNWKQANAEYCIYYWPNDNWIEMTPSSENGIWEAELPVSYEGFKFVRMNPSRSSNSWDSSSKWNEDKNVDLTAMGSNNLYTLNDGWDNMGGTWSVYTPPVIEVAVPEFSVATRRFSEPFELTITAEDGATIYYSIDGTDPSIVYENPITISETTTVKAFAQKDDKSSSIIEATYTYVITADVTFFVNNQKYWNPINLYCWEDGGSQCSNSWPGNQMNYITIEGVEGNWYSVTLQNIPVNRALRWIFNNNSEQTSDSDPFVVEEYDTDPTDGYQVYLTLSSDGGSITGIDGIEAENAPVEYFNLQGVRVANPENGLYIRRQGNKVEKVFLNK